MILTTSSEKIIASLLAIFCFVAVFVNNDEKFVSCFQPPQHKKSTARIRRTTSMATSSTTTTTTNTFPPIPVLFESSRVLIIHKPHGIGHHDESSTLSSSEQQEKPGILQILRQQRREEKEDEDDDDNDNEERLYGIHRLDKVTSGILVFAKDSITASILSKYFQEKKIQKIYFGLSGKKALKKKQGLVQGGMERSRNKGWILVSTKNKNKNNKKSTATTTTAAPAPTTSRHNNFAKTRFFTASMNNNDVNSNDNDKSNNNNNSNNNSNDVVKSVIMFRPYTGKTHQIRVAAKSMGIPLLGDPVYKDGGNNGGENNSSSTSRTMLHASGIHIPEFLDHNEINIWCPPTFFDDNDDDNNVVIIDDDDNDNDPEDRFDNAVEKLMTKNCDVDGILEAMKMTNKMKSNRNGQSIKIASDSTV